MTYVGVKGFPERDNLSLGAMGPGPGQFEIFVFHPSNKGLLIKDTGAGSGKGKGNGAGVGMEKSAGNGAGVGMEKPACQG